MASETSMRGRVTHALKPLDAIAVENGVLPGTPDVEFIGGWVELKSLDAWPARHETPVRCDHFNPEQRAWLRRRIRRGGKAWLLLRVGKEWLLFDGATAADILGTATRVQLAQATVRHWQRTPTDEELLMTFREVSL
jgi:hypothetical protein